MANENVIHIGSEEAFNKLMAGDTPVLVDFWATWCGPCRMVAPIVAQIAEEQEGVVKVGKVNVDDEPALANMFGIESIPTVMVFKEGKITGTSLGYRPKEQITAML